MDQFVAHIERSVRGRHLFRDGERVLVAVSGGLDSMVMLHALHALALRHRWTLTVAHLNHRLRGRSSDADERLVRSTCRSLRIPCVSGRADVRALAHEQKISIEMAARQARHAFLAKTAARRRVKVIALAHHADDQLELFFLRLFRGTSGEGLAGMRWKSPSPAKASVTLVRPLLDLGKAQLAEYATRNRVTFREDNSNSNVDFQRNRIRHELLPLIRRHYQPSVGLIASRLMDIAGAESEFTGRCAEAWVGARRRLIRKAGRRFANRNPASPTTGLGRSDRRIFGDRFLEVPFGELPMAVQRRCIQIQLLEAGVQPEFDLIEALRQRPGRPVSVSPGLSSVLSLDGLVRLTQAQPNKVNFGSREEMKVRIKGSRGRVQFNGVKFSWAIGPRGRSIPARSRAGREVFDAGQVGSTLLLRHWRPGDRFQPIGMPNPVKVQDLFTNLKVPRLQRHQAVVLTTASGELIWVEFLRISERFKLCNRTIRSLHWRWKRL